MKAITRYAYGAPDNLELRDIDKPTIGDDDVLVRVHAAGVDPGVWHLITGVPYLLRLGGFGLRRPKNPVQGMDVAGRVEAVGANVTDFRPGDEVFGTCDGAYAEYACARQDGLATKPASITFAQAATVPGSACAALQGLRDAGKTPGRPARAGHRRRRNVRRAARQGFRRARHRRVPDQQDRPGPIHRGRRRHRPHP
ncbi:NAD(P)-dependent alcohol dehydrogenase [Nonomuraea turcica]|uniref:NAD(P)-dependent alcohol dehydrogenase n=1 Tax=Nonomuraea sp. G32 TaxID=3067274 RepID=UPI00273A918D|nr:NAD(P)-dependent alcohol dehydrogenase [Nonomuraea sp. G32]MDP4511998.1 NAD(P)-dependent alcohol dehydrogenase [Nonomuraea sp. G32]